eukprot:TRINITY_DN10103_c0_g1_i2.p1 TRINITY_DN10103_c0_g1~~TRINITY_DN10103_c0_g1_i2.p1  ORF type:complete len:243 (-),score=42.44 TRINITY_DN10103_c0_g1_i2:57-785(-)
MEKLDALIFALENREKMTFDLLKRGQSHRDTTLIIWYLTLKRHIEGVPDAQDGWSWEPWGSWPDAEEYRSEILRLRPFPSVARFIGTDTVVHGEVGCIDLCPGKSREDDFRLAEAWPITSRHYANHLVFDFEKTQLLVASAEGCSISHDCRLEEYIETIARKFEGDADPTFEMVVRIGELMSNGGFNHASCQCSMPRENAYKFKAFDLLDYPSVDHVHLLGYIDEDTSDCRVYVVYGGIVAL